MVKRPASEVIQSLESEVVRLRGVVAELEAIRRSPLDESIGDDEAYETVDGIESVDDGNPFIGLNSADIKSVLTGRLSELSIERNSALTEMVNSLVRDRFIQLKRVHLLMSACDVLFALPLAVTSESQVVSELQSQLDQANEENRDLKNMVDVSGESVAALHDRNARLSQDLLQAHVQIASLREINNRE